MRIFRKHRLAARDSEALQPLKQVRSDRLRRHVRVMQPHSRNPLPVDPLIRVQRVNRILQNDRHLTGAVPVPVAPLHIEQISSQRVRPEDNPSLRLHAAGQERRHGIHRHRLAGA